MTEHKIDEGLRSLGVDPASLDPDVLAALRHAKDANVTDQATDYLESLFQQGRQPLTFETITH